MKILPVGIDLVPCGKADRQTDMANLIIAFRNYANAPKTIMTGLLIFYNVQKIHDDLKFFHVPSPLNKWYQVLSQYTSSSFCVVTAYCRKLRTVAFGGQRVLYSLLL
jgi:hypothetical protein